MKASKRTLLYLIRQNHILLAMKKRGFGAGRWNGVGGKLESGESLNEAAIRECQEEIGVTPVHFWQVAELDFIGGSDKDQWRNYVHVYLCNQWRGKPAESEEMAPKWFKLSEVPYDEMWDSDKLWLPKILTGKIMAGRILFDKNDKMTKMDLHEVPTPI